MRLRLSSLSFLSPALGIRPAIAQTGRGLPSTERPNGFPSHPKTMPTSTRSTSLGFLDVREPFAMWQPQHPKDPLGDVSIVGNIPREITPSRLECLEISGGNRHVSHPFELPGLAGWIHSEPVEPSILGGDVHFISLCAKGIISRFALADVSGHGQSSSIIAQLLWDLIRRHINTWDQSELMRELNEALRSEVDENQFATVALFAYCRSTRELVFTNAGHPPALWYHAETGIWDWLEPATAFTRSVEGLPLGLIPMANYVQVAVRLDRSDLMILYTDGITEATDAAGNMLGQDGLLGIVQKLPLEFPGQMAVGLLGALQEFRGTALPDDDQTFFILRQLEG